MTDFIDISLLRIVGLCFGSTLLLYVFYRLRTYKLKRTNVWLFFLFGLTLILVSSFPSALNFPSQLLFLYEVQGGRVITLLLFLSIIFWFLLLSEREKGYKRDKNFEYLFRKVMAVDVSNKYHIDDKSYEIVIVIPAFNEAKNLEKVLPRIPSKIDGNKIGVVIVNDGSSDDTGDVARRNNTILVEHPSNRGGGAALRSGYQIAELLNAKVIVTMDADGQHQPEEVSILVKPILNDEADIVIGSRFLKGGYTGSKIRIAGILVFNYLIQKLLGMKVTDCTSGYRAFNPKELRKINLIQNQYHTAELIIDAIKRGCTVVERPITISKRLTGHSKKGSNLRYGLSFLKVVLRTWLR